MKAVVVNPESTGVEIIQNKELRPLETGEALVEIEYCGVCHTELHMVTSARSQAVSLVTKGSVSSKNWLLM